MNSIITRLILCTTFTIASFSSVTAFGQSGSSYNVDVSGADYSIIKTLSLSGNKIGVLIATPGYASVYLWVYNTAGTRITNIDITSLVTWPHPNRLSTEFNALVASNGNIFITYTASDVTDKLTDNARYIVLNESGAQLASGQANTTDPGNSLTRFFELTNLSNGKLLMLFQRTDNASYAFRIFNPDGKAVTTNDVVYTGPGTENTFDNKSIYTNKVAAFKNGNFLISLYYNGGTLRGLLFDNNGNSIRVDGSSNFLIESTVSSDYWNKGIVPLANGNAAIFWTLYGTTYFKILSSDGSMVQDTRELGTTCLGNFLPVNTAGSEGFMATEYTPQDEGDYSNPYTKVSVVIYDQSGVLQSSTPTTEGFLIAPVYNFIPGIGAGYAYLYSYYKSFTPYPKDLYFKLTSDADIKIKN